MKVFLAKYASKCAGCGDRISPDDEVAYLADQVVHEECHDDYYD